MAYLMMILSDRELADPWRWRSCRIPTVPFDDEEARLSTCATFFTVFSSIFWFVHSTSRMVTVMHYLVIVQMCIEGKHSGVNKRPRLLFR